MGITEENLDTLLASKLFLVIALDAEFPDIVARLIVVVLLDIVWRHLCHITQHVGCHVILVLSHAAPLYIEAREPVHLLLEDTEVLVAELTHEELLGEA